MALAILDFVDDDASGTYALPPRIAGAGMDFGEWTGSNCESVAMGGAHVGQWHQSYRCL